MHHVDKVPLNIWLIQIGEPLPVDGEGIRLFRTGILAGMLAERGHDVTWWASTFDHFNRNQRYYRDTEVVVREGLRLVLLHGPGYGHNVSLKRAVDHGIVTRRFHKRAYVEKKPDVILCSYPTVGLSLAAVRYGERMKVPVVLDARDMWPDTFLNIFPRRMRPVAGIFIFPVKRRAKKAFRGAHAVTGMTSSFVDWGLHYAGRKKTPRDKPFPFGYLEGEPERSMLERAEAYWDGLGLKEDDFIVCFFGTIGKQFNLEEVIGAAAALEKRNGNLTFVLCGDGEKLRYYRKMAQGCRSVVFPGRVGRPEIWDLMRRACVGIAPYRESEDFTMSVPNKIVEYLSGGLPVLSNLEGETARLIQENRCGTSYRRGDVPGLEKELEYLRDNRPVLAELSRNALRLFKGRFTAEKVYGEMTEYLQSIARHGK